MHGCYSTKWIRNGNYQVPERTQRQTQSKYSDDRITIVIPTLKVTMTRSKSLLTRTFTLKFPQKIMTLFF